MRLDANLRGVGGEIASHEHDTEREMRYEGIDTEGSVDEVSTIRARSPGIWITVINIAAMNAITSRPIHA